jgi:hypothetical protein
MRGGRVVFQDVPKPTTEDWKTALEAVQAALELEKKVNAVIWILRLRHKYVIFNLNAGYVVLFSPSWYAGKFIALFF